MAKRNKPELDNKELTESSFVESDCRTENRWKVIHKCSNKYTQNKHRMLNWRCGNFCVSMLTKDMFNKGSSAVWRYYWNTTLRQIKLWHCEWSRWTLHTSVFMENMFPTLLFPSVSLVWSWPYSTRCPDSSYPLLTLDRDSSPQLASSCRRSRLVAHFPVIVRVGKRKQGQVSPQGSTSSSWSSWGWSLPPVPLLSAPDHQQLREPSYTSYFQ